MSGEGERASRPSSLVLDVPSPEREPLHFDVHLIGAPPEVEQLVNNIKQVAEDFLYHWKTFPIVLPPSRFTGPGNRLSDIIIPPPCDELDSAAFDSSIDPEPLSPKQLQSIREKGEFEVPSRHFPGQTHVWRVAGWLQRGRARAREEFLQNVANALALVVVVARDRICSARPLSLRAGRDALLQGLYRLLDLLIGMPSMEARDLEKKIREERSRYLVAELICKPEHEEDIAAVAAWVTRAMRRAAADKQDPRDALRSPPRLPLHYTTPQRTMVDLRLYRRDVVRRAAPALQAILEREARGWFLHFRERTAAHLAAQKVPKEDIEEEVRLAAMHEYVSRVCSGVVASEALAALGAGVPQLLAEQLRAGAALERAEAGVRRRLAAGLAGAEARLRVRHPLLARAAAWRGARLAAAARRLRLELRWAAREDAAAALHALKLPQHRYFLLRDLAFLREREPLLAAELRAATAPTREFLWRARAEVATSTRWPGWRLANAAQRARCWTWSVVFVLAVAVAWRSPLALRTLLRRAPAGGAGGAAGSAAGSLAARTHTMWSRLLALWRHVSKERRRIDSEPDTGLLGAGVWRAVQRAWCAAVGVLGSAALLLLFPPVVLLVCGAALLAAAAAPLWVPPLALLAHLAHALVYDADCPRPGELNRWFPLVEVVVWRVGALGVAQPLLALAAALLLLPLSALLLGASALWAGARAAWEAAAWRGVLARAARVPTHESRYCRRVAGPGLPAQAHYRVSAAQAAAAAAASAEADALADWAARTERAVERPLRDYKHFVDACFGPFSVQIAKTGSYLSLERECAALVRSVRGAAAARRRDLELPLPAAARARVRLPADELRRARGAAAAELRRVWRHEPRAPDWWAARGLDQDDWPALAAAALVEAFDGDVLTPLEEGAARLSLEAGAGAHAWAARVARAAPPDLVAAAGALGGAAPRVPPPSLDVAAFSPRAPRLPPLPPPAVVALVLHNRDADAPLPLDCDLCADVLRALEDAPDAGDAAGAVERYRGGGSSDGSSSDGDDDERRPVCRTVESGDGAAAGDGVVPRGDGAVPRGEGAVPRGACRWTLTGRGVRLRADLASPEDVTLDAERRGTSV